MISSVEYEIIEMSHQQYGQGHNDLYIVLKTESHPDFVFI